MNHDLCPTYLTGLSMDQNEITCMLVFCKMLMDVTVSNAFPAGPVQHFIVAA